MFLSLLGPSGCGKTTLLRVIAGTLAPDGGRVHAWTAPTSRDLPTHRRNMGMVFQSFALFPHLSVAGNVAFPLRVRGVAAAEQQSRVAEALRMVHLDALCDAIRASCPAASSSASDWRGRSSIGRRSCCWTNRCRTSMRRCARRCGWRSARSRGSLGITAVYVTHDQREALALSDAIAVMNRGRVVQFGAPEEIYRAPVDDFIARFVGYANALPVIVADGQTRASKATGRCWRRRHRLRPVQPPHSSTRVPWCWRARPHRRPNRLACTVVDLAFMGDHVEYVLRHPTGIQLKAHAPVGAAAHPRGAEVSVAAAVRQADRGAAGIVAW